MWCTTAVEFGQPQYKQIVYFVVGLVPMLATLFSVLRHVESTAVGLGGNGSVPCPTASSVTNVTLVINEGTVDEREVVVYPKSYGLHRCHI